MAAYYECRLTVNDDLTIKCCHCYADYWKNVRKSENNEIHMDYSIGKNKTIRKFVIDEKFIQ